MRNRLREGNYKKHKSNRGSTKGICSVKTDTDTLKKTGVKIKIKGSSGQTHRKHRIRSDLNIDLGLVLTLTPDLTIVLILNQL